MVNTIKQIPKIWMSTILAIFLMFFIAACGGSSSVEPESDGAASEAQATAPTDTPEPPATELPDPTDIPEPTATKVPDPTDTPITVSDSSDETLPTESGTEPTIMDLDINRAPGHSIVFENALEPDGSHRFLFLASPGDTIGASITSSANLLIGIQNANSGEILAVVPSNDDSLFVTIPENALYHIVIEGADGNSGDYVAAFEASPRVSFALETGFFTIGRLPEGSLLSYTYTAPGGVTLQGNAIPHPDTPVDLIIKIRDLESQEVLIEFNESGPGENEPFTFTFPDKGDGKLQTYIISVEDIDRNKGAYILALTSNVTDPEFSSAVSPERVVQIIFDAAKSGDLSALQGLCDPLGENDGDTQMICDLATDDTNRDEFVQYFSAGEIRGDAIISPDGDRAEVPFLFGPDGNSEETMELIYRNGQWYLFGF